VQHVLYVVLNFLKENMEIIIRNSHSVHYSYVLIINLFYYYTFVSGHKVL